MYICIIRNIIVSIHLFWYIFTISSIESNKIILLETIESGLLLGVYIGLTGIRRKKPKKCRKRVMAYIGY